MTKNRCKSNNLSHLFQNVTFSCCIVILLDFYKKTILLFWVYWINQHILMNSLKTQDYRWKNLKPWWLTKKCENHSSTVIFRRDSTSEWVTEWYWITSSLFKSNFAEDFRCFILDRIKRVLFGINFYLGLLKILLQIFFWYGKALLQMQIIFLCPFSGKRSKLTNCYQNM